MKIFQRIFFIVGIFLLSTPINAETHYKPHMWVGGRAGMTMSRMSFSPSVSQRWLMGSTGTITFRYSEEKFFGFIAELGWVQRGWSENFGDDNPLRYSRQLTYLHLPFMSHIYFGTPRFKCFVNLGPEIDFLVNSSISANFDYHNPKMDENWPTRNRRTEQLTMTVSNKFDYGICGGIGFEFYAKPKHSIVAEVRFSYGLGNIFPSSKADTFGASRSMSLDFTLGYNFRLQ